MGRKTKYNLGDIFLMPLENGLYICGRVVKKDEDTIFVELFKMQPIKDKLSFKMDDICITKPLISEWSYDDGFIDNQWEIIDNIPIEKDYEMPDFYSRCSFTDQHYLVKGGDTFEGIYTGIKISEQEAQKLASKGIGNPISLSRRYMKKLKELNMV
jgi:hypothetical protein